MKSKIKKIIVLAMAITTLLGATLTVNAANPPSPSCKRCAAQPDHVNYQGTTYSGGQIFYHWTCTVCHYNWSSRVY